METNLSNTNVGQKKPLLRSKGESYKRRIVSFPKLIFLVLVTLYNEQLIHSNECGFLHRW